MALHVLAISGGNGNGGALDFDADGATIDQVTNTTFAGNQAVGGQGGRSEYGIGSFGTGGAVASLAVDGTGAPTLTMSACTISSNIAQGGQAEFDIYHQGGIAQGGGIDLSSPQLTVVLSNDTITLNQALGGAGQPSVNGQLAGDGGEAYGGGIWSDGTAMTINQGFVTHNDALGADGPEGSAGSWGGSAGGAGGGGLSLAEVNLSATGVIIDYNQANSGNGGDAGLGGYLGGSGGGAAGGLGGLGGQDGTNGQGIGGGVYLSTTGSTKTGTKITGNTASTSNNNVYGSFEN